MSRVGKKPLPIPHGVQVTVQGNLVTVKGPKGTLQQEIMAGVTVVIENDTVWVKADAQYSKFQGLLRALIANMVAGVVSGYEKTLELIGVGFRAAVQGALLDLQLGFSHPTKLQIPQGILVKVDKNTVIVVSGIHKQRVGQFAADVRAIKPPEPYKGKGIRYKDEYVRKKAGKSAAAKK